MGWNEAMIPVFLPLLRIALLLTLFVAGLGAISSLLPESKPHDFANMDASSLWTTHPVKVDVRAQRFQRLPPLNVGPENGLRTAKASTEDGREAKATVNESLEGDAVDHTLVTGAITGSADTVYDNAPHVEWCRNRYNSYRAYDNTYQPYNGRRRRCQPPFAVIDAGNGAPVNEEPTAYGNDMHGRWCAARYRSYDARDNTYRSYSGQRRPCRSPYL